VQYDFGVFVSIYTISLIRAAETLWRGPSLQSATHFPLLTVPPTHLKGWKASKHFSPLGSGYGCGTPIIIIGRASLYLEKAFKSTDCCRVDARFESSKRK
jgi:hypothetical protein